MFFFSFTSLCLDNSLALLLIGDVAMEFGIVDSGRGGYIVRHDVK